jgi:hypothetical protein
LCQSPRPADDALFNLLTVKTLKMVTVKAYHLRKSAEGKSFISLELTGELEMVQSQNTGRFYATSRRCFIYSTLDEQTAKAFIGKTMPGTIVRTSCEPYQYTVPETGELITLTHRYTYVPEERQMNVPNPSSILTAV